MAFVTVEDVCLECLPIADRRHPPHRDREAAVTSAIADFVDKLR